MRRRYKRPIMRYMSYKEFPEVIYDFNYREHLPLFAGVTSSFFIAIRILAISDFNIDTSYAILQNAGVASVIVGAILASIGYFAAMALFTVTLITGRRFAELGGPGVGNNLLVVTAITALVGIFDAPFILLSPLLFFAIGPVWYHIIKPTLYKVRRFRVRVVNAVAAWPLNNRLKSWAASYGTPAASVATRGVARRARKRSEEVLMCLTLVLAFFTVVVLASPWMPAEKLKLSNGKTITAYVLTVNNGYYSLLMTGRPPRVRYVAQADIHGRALCDLENALVTDSLAEIASSSWKAYPSCETGSRRPGPGHPPDRRRTSRAVVKRRVGPAGLEPTRRA
jgi:hypothetical protein